MRYMRRTVGRGQMEKRGAGRRRRTCADRGRGKQGGGEQ